MSKRLSPTELASAAVMADLAVGIVVIAKLTPFAYLTTVLGGIPFAVLALRQRREVVTVAFWIAVILTFLLAGFSSAAQVLVMAVFGAVSGRAYRAKWSKTRTALTAVVVGWTVVATLSVGVLAIFPGFRRLNLDVAATQWQGSSRLLTRIGLESVARSADPIVTWSIENWFIALPALQLFFSVVVVLLIGRIGRPTVERVDQAVRTGAGPRVPDDLIDSVLKSTGLTVVTGPNGAGKSTLLRAASHARPELLGATGGVAWIGQRPDSQIVGARVRDDLVWGLDPIPSAGAISAALESVGLDGFETRETDTLSGGEQQRLAVAAALMRSPRLLLSDETTAMLDPAGRKALRATLKRVATQGTAVVHASHLDGDLDLGTRRINVRGR
jgi:energy-coupling factor transport system ATP-binding protein